MPFSPDAFAFKSPWQHVRCSVIAFAAVVKTAHRCMAFHSDSNTSPSRSLISGSSGKHPEDCVRMSVGVVLIRHRTVCACVRACTQPCPTLRDPIDCSPPGTSVILQVRILEWAASSFSRGSSRPGDQTQVSCISRQPTTEPPGKPTSIAVGYSQNNKIRLF